MIGLVLICLLGVQSILRRHTRSVHKCPMVQSRFVPIKLVNHGAGFCDGDGDGDGDDGGDGIINIKCGRPRADALSLIRRQSEEIF